MSDDAQPDWSRLPDDPRGFFALSHNFDRRELKTAYGRFIRRFKPEQHPAEFQKIRAAYEQLDLQLRYGATVDASVSAANADWRAVSTSSISSSESTTGTTPRAVFQQIHVRLQTETPEAIYQELAGLTHKTPYDYFALALLSDVVASASQGRFATWLIAGVAEYPRELALYYLLQRHFQGPIHTELLPKLLTQSARQLTELYFYPLTEKLWRQLLREQGFAVFHETLTRCLDFQPGIQIANRLTFYLQILRQAVWVADPAWITATTTYIEENFHQIPYQLGDEIDLLLALQNYASFRQEFIARHPFRAAMDVVLRSYFTEDEVTADQQMLACQMQILNDPMLAAAAFPDPDEPGLHAFYSLWAWLSRDAADRNFGEVPPQQFDRVWQSQAKSLVLRAEQLANWSRFGLKWSGLKLTYLGMMGFGILAIPTFMIMFAIAAALSFSNRSNEDLILGTTCVITFIVGLYLAFRWCKYVQRRWLAPLDVRMMSRSYTELWQPEVFGLVERSHLPVHFLVHLIRTSTLSITREHLIAFIERDYGLAVFSLAQRYSA